MLHPADPPGATVDPDTNNAFPGLKYSSIEDRRELRAGVKRLIKAILVDYLPEDVADIHANVLATGILYGGLESRFKLTEMALREALRSRGYSEDAIKQVVKRVEEEVKAIGGGKP